jgi:4-hydroxythreonine-4-phosphate dehydrogenase
MPEQPVIAITSGEPAGIGPQLMADINPARHAARLVVIGDPQLLQTRASMLGKILQSTPFNPDQPAPRQGLEVIPVALTGDVEPGVLNSANAGYVLQTLDLACQGCLDGRFAAMVTAPIQKDIINRAGITFSGHTEYLAQQCGGQKPVMLLATDTLRVALATTHLPLRAVADAIDSATLEHIITILDQDLRSRFALNNPHIKVCGLNPHAGENGYLGREEIDVIIPLITRLKQQGVNLSGPWPADTVFTQDSLRDADAVLAMYHDQGLPVLKHAGFNHAINTTLGLPIIRTSVDHGTALHLAGKPGALPDSLFAAIDSAIAQHHASLRQA